MKIKFPPLSKVYLPHHVPIHENRDRFLVLWGGRGGAKSTDAAKKLVIRCLTEPYFKQILLRKTYASIKDSQYSQIKSIIKDWNLEHLFDFLKSPLEIRCRNGNTFIARGLDKEDTTKSIDNPTGIWYEEANQITEEDFIASSTSIRTPKATYLQEILTLNPECKTDFEKFWLYKRFGFKEHSPALTYRGKTETVTDDGETIVQYYSVIHSTYSGNRFLPKEYVAEMEGLKKIDPYYHKVFARGLWGNRKNKSPYAFAYDKAKHSSLPEYNPNELVYLSFDFNKNPICASVFQWYDEKVDCLRTIKIPNSDIYELCEQIKSFYPDSVFLVTGDASGQSRSAMVKGNIHYYSIIQQELGLGSQQIRVPTVNPSLESNSLLVNAVLANYPILFHEVDAEAMHYDLANVKKRADGKIDKGNRDDPSEQADALDTLRYFINTFLSHLFVFK